MFLFPLEESDVNLDILRFSCSFLEEEDEGEMFDEWDEGEDAEED